jgi:uncharacterized membrane protein
VFLIALRRQGSSSVRNFGFGAIELLALLAAAAAWGEWVSRGSDPGLAVPTALFLVLGLVLSGRTSILASVKPMTPMQRLVGPLLVGTQAVLVSIGNPGHLGRVVDSLPVYLALAFVVSAFVWRLQRTLGTK